MRSKLAVTLFALLLTASALEARDLFIEIWCPDLNEDGWVGFRDVEQLVSVQGSCPTQPWSSDDPCPEDFNHNGVVGRLDLVHLIGNWGQCRCKGDLDGNGLRDQTDVDLLDEAIAAGLDCRADIDHSGEVGPSDLELEYVSWTAEPDSDPRSDVNDSGGLTAADVLEVFTALSSSRDCRGEVTGDGLVNALDRIVVVALANSDPVCP